ncbi:MAG TPA: hypothetical protein VM911_01530 [Pyrinomonadaceae bacterium]|jgi:hypothetical protein|nr:hypothetical protein [Pyrinomonadaceae bacterium]
MCIAIPSIAMRMIEAITIYLAAGAPFGVSYYLQRKPRKRSASSFLKATAAALLWPLSAATIFLARRRRLTISAMSDDDPAHGSEPDAQRIEQARRRLIGALYKVEELARAASAKEGKRIELVAYTVRESIEKYTGLMLNSFSASTDAAPAEREMELCRISGRKGADLLLAGRCIHRRNVARLLAHRERARTNLLHALAEVRELSPSDDAVTAQRNLSAARHASVAILRFYAHAINLLSLLEDERAARVTARLLDAECARLRRLENSADRNSAPEEAMTARAAGEEEECKPHIPPLAFIGPSRTGTLPQG